MFDGVLFMLRGNMCCCIEKNDLSLVGAPEAEQLIMFKSKFEFRKGGPR